MKKFFSILGWLILVLIFLALNAVNVYRFFEFLASIVARFGFGSVLRGIVTLPFALFGVVQIFRGAILLLNEDGEMLDRKPKWLQNLYIISSLLAYPAAIILLVSCLSN